MKKDLFDYDSFYNYIKKKYEEGYKVFISNYDNLDYKDLKKCYLIHTVKGVSSSKRSNVVECIYSFDEDDINLQETLF